MAREASEWLRLDLGCMAEAFRNEDVYLRTVLAYLRSIRTLPTNFTEDHWAEDSDLDIEPIERLEQYLTDTVLSIPSDRRSFEYRADYDLDPVPVSATSTTWDSEELVGHLLTRFLDYFRLEGFMDVIPQMLAMIPSPSSDADPPIPAELSAAALLRLMGRAAIIEDPISPSMVLAETLTRVFGVPIEEIDEVSEAISMRLQADGSFREFEELCRNSVPPEEDDSRGTGILVDFLSGAAGEELEKLIFEHRRAMDQPRKKHEKQPDNQLSLFDEPHSSTPDPPADDSALEPGIDAASFRAEALYADSIFRLQAMGDAEGSVQSVQRALEAKPDYAPAILTMGSIQHQSGNSERCMELLMSLLSLPADTKDLCEIIDEAGEYLIKSDEWEDGLAFYRKAAERFPDVAVFHQGITCCAGHMCEFDLSLRAAMTALAMEPENQVFVNDLGWSLFESNRMDESYRLLSRATMMDPEDKRARGNLQECTEAIGETITEGLQDAGIRWAPDRILGELSPRGFYYMYRKPEFPVISSQGGAVRSALTEIELEWQLLDSDSRSAETVQIVDVNGTEWYYMSGRLTTAPRMGEKWTKKDIVKLFNDSDTARRAGLTYSTGSLSPGFDTDGHIFGAPDFVSC